MTNYDVQLKLKDGKLKKIKVCANTIDRAKQIAMYWEDKDTIIDKIVPSE